MELLPGVKVGSYEVVASLGRGGMGEVYCARDTRLNRQVAIKFLATDVADADARRRFQQEAQTASSLNHPHILTVFEVGDWDGRQYLVTEFLDGGTLKDWARTDTRSWRQIVDLLVGVADGLAAAHVAGILHRDVKPENILVTKNGYAKLADFGLAKLAEPTELAVTRTVEAPTRHGVIVGTIAYMSPEQAAGKPLDARSDIFSFGCVLYELLAGRRPFPGTSDLEVLQSLAHRTPEPLAATTPAPLRAIVEKALEKEPADRYQTMRDLVVDLRRALRGRVEDSAAALSVARPRTPWLVAIVASAALAVGFIAARWIPTTQPSAWRNPLDGATFTRLTDFEGVEADASISPDGNFVAFLSDRDGPMDVWVLQLGSGQFLNLTRGQLPSLFSSQVRAVGFTPDGSHVTVMTRGGNAGDIRTSIIPTIGGPIRILLDGGLVPQWSPDGTRLAFVRLEQDIDMVYVADPDGANRRQLFPEAHGGHNHFLAWSPSGRDVYTARSTRNVQEYDVWRVATAGGTPERITHHNGWIADPILLDERTLLYSATDEGGAGPWLYATDLDRREEHRLSVGIERYSSIAMSRPTNGPRRRLAVTLSNPTGSLWSVPVGDSPAPESAASVFPVPTAQVSSPRFGPDYMLYLSSRELADGLWRLQDHTSTELWNAKAGAILAAPSISRDGRSIAVSAWKQGRAGIYVMTADGANPQPLAPSLEVREAPSWSPDGSALAVTGYDDKGPSLFLVTVDGRSITRLYDKLCYLPAWSPDARVVLFAEYFQGTLMRLKAVTPEGKPVTLPEIHMTRTGSSGAMSSPYRFLPDGKSLVMMDGEWRKPQFWLVNLETGARRQLTDLRPGRSTRSFDITPDGKRILFDRVQENSDIVLIELSR